MLTTSASNLILSAVILAHYSSAAPLANRQLPILPSIAGGIPGLDSFGIGNALPSLAKIEGNVIELKARQFPGLPALPAALPALPVAALPGTPSLPVSIPHVQIFASASAHVAGLPIALPNAAAFPGGVLPAGVPKLPVPAGGLPALPTNGLPSLPTGGLPSVPLPASVVPALPFRRDLINAQAVATASLDPSSLDPSSLSNNPTAILSSLPLVGSLPLPGGLAGSLPGGLDPSSLLSNPTAILSSLPLVGSLPLPGGLAGSLPGGLDPSSLLANPTAILSSLPLVGSLPLPGGLAGSLPGGVNPSSLIPALPSLPLA
ncbi:hypothetical protein RQP46_007982 [Phenoliferia psychrophenolica]